MGGRLFTVVRDFVTPRHDQHGGRRDYDQEDAPLGMIQWAQFVLKMTSATAVIVIAGFLVWRMAGGFDLYASKMDELTRQHTEISQQFRTSDMMTRRMLVVLRVMCVNAAKSEDARQSCLQETIP